MKAPIADAAGRDALPSGTACDSHAPISVSAVTRGRCRRVRLVIRCQFATATMSDGRIATCYGLQIGRQVSGIVTRAEPAPAMIVPATAPGYP
jgi:hypothetical protein